MTFAPCVYHDGVEVLDMYPTSNVQKPHFHFFSWVINEATQVTHVSFWFHWFPTSLLLLSLDMGLRKPAAISFMGQVKHTLGSERLSLFIAAMLVFSYWISSKPSEQVDWQRFGFSRCPFYLGGDSPSPSIPYVLAGVLFQPIVFVSLHLAAAPVRPAPPVLLPVSRALAVCNGFSDLRELMVYVVPAIVGNNLAYNNIYIYIHTVYMIIHIFMYRV